MKWKIRNSSRAGLWWLMLASSVIVLYGCNNAHTAQPSQTDSTTPKWQVSLTISGGLSGQSRSISIDHQGVAQFTDHLKKTQKNSQISKTDLNKLAKLVKNYSTPRVTNNVKSIDCRDCYNYAINAEYNGNVYRQQVNDFNMDKNTQRLIGALKTISSEHAQQIK